MKKVLLLRPRGFCAGVVRAIDIVNIALDAFGPPIYVRKEIVHNRYVVEELSARGAIFVDCCLEVPSGGRIIFSAHGVSPQVRQEARDRQLQVIDATCPLVTKVHLEAVKFARRGYTILLIGHRDHDEVAGTLGEAPGRTILISSDQDAENVRVPDPERVVYLTQTTLSLDETTGMIQRLRRRFPAIQGPPAQDICYATENRQHAVKAIARRCDLLLVVGSQNSSNSNRLVEVAANAKLPAHLIEDEQSIDPQWLEAAETIGVTAGASAPERLVERVILSLRNCGFSTVEEVEVIEEATT
jgi:4-hydroxy-3-methylbut-2-enyl diphosphate reductase